MRDDRTETRVKELAGPVAAGDAAPQRRLGAIAAFLALGAVTLTAVLVGNSRGGEEPRQPTVMSDSHLLFSGECREPVRYGQRDGCVRELQKLLAAAGTTIMVDGIFGQETLRRLEAFQVLAGLTPDGIAGNRTKRALYAGDVSLTTWNKKRVADRIREVFTEKPDTAVKIARCQSLLDPLHIAPNADRSRNWGVFQLSDVLLRDLRATPEQALEPEWNIRAAHRVWSRNEDFGDWPHCFAATRDDHEKKKEKEKEDAA
jgi:Putative peptidoglycan binding domain